MALAALLVLVVAEGLLVLLEVVKTALAAGHLVVVMAVVVAEQPAATDSVEMALLARLG
jgi:hypothetical protein